MEFAPTPIQFLWEDEQGNRLYVKRRRVCFFVARYGREWRREQ